MWEAIEITSDAFSDSKWKLALYLTSHMNFLLNNLPPTSEPARKCRLYQSVQCPCRIHLCAPPCPEQCLAHSRSLANISWPKRRTEMCSRTNLQKHFFMLGIIRVIGFSAQFFHICNKVSVPNNLQKASLKRDSQPNVLKNRRNTHEGKKPHSLAFVHLMYAQ